MILAVIIIIISLTYSCYITSAVYDRDLIITTLKAEIDRIKKDRKNQ